MIKALKGRISKYIMQPVLTAQVPALCLVYCVLAVVALVGHILLVAPSPDHDTVTAT